jgi:glycerate 2-kinase
MVICNHRSLILASETASDHPRAVVVLMSGGGSSLFELPQAPLTLHELQTINGLLLKSGADITELNAVRKHLSAVKGGQLARHVIEGLPNMEGTARDSVLISLVLSDVIGDPLDVIASGPTVPDTSTYADVSHVTPVRTSS